MSVLIFAIISCDQLNFAIFTTINQWISAFSSCDHLNSHFFLQLAEEFCEIYCYWLVNFVGFFLQKFDEFHDFPCEQQLVNLWIFSNLLIKITSIFFFMQSMEMLFNPPPPPMTHWRILRLFFHTDWQISEICSHVRSTNFSVFLWKQMIKFTIYFLWSMNTLHEFFLLRPEKEMKQKCASKISVRTIASIN